MNYNQFSNDLKNISLSSGQINEAMEVYTKLDRSNAYFTDSKLYTVFKGDEMYTVEIKKGYPMRWKYHGKAEPNKAMIGNGKLVKGNQKNKEFFIILNNQLKKPTEK